MCDLLDQFCAVSQLSTLFGQGLSHRDGGNRRGLPSSGQGSDGDHRCAMGSSERRSRSQTASAGDQWNFDAHWTNHEQQEYQRNHRTKFSEMPSAAPRLKLISGGKA